MARIRLHIHLAPGRSLGPGKIELLETVAALGSISAAARSMGMAYRHAWELVEDLNATFERPVVTASAGGRRGGGAQLTPFGDEIVRRFRAMERTSRAAIDRDLRALDGALASPARTSRRPSRALARGRPRSL